MIKVLLFAVIALLLIWIYLRMNQGRSSGSSDDRKLPATDRGEFHAVAIRFSEHACAAAKRHAGERFLASESPELPLQDCDVAKCECSFAHYDDRRSGYDRRSPFDPALGSSGTGLHEIERRQSGGRRKDD